MNKIEETKSLIRSGKASRGVIFPKLWLKILGVDTEDNSQKVKLVLNIDKKTITITKAT